MLDIQNILNTLSKKRPIFHSEADFQHALAWEIHEYFSESKIRLEIPPHATSSKKEYVDISVIIGNIKIPIELKYKTREGVFTYENETFYLAKHGAHPVSRYDFIKDIQRVESFIREKDSYGYAIFLTNDPSYWKPTDKETIDCDFRIHENRALSGNLFWGEGASEGTIKGREESLTLLSSYTLNWQTYSTYLENLKMLVVKVTQ